MADPASNNLGARVGDFFLAASGPEQLPFVLWLAAGFAAGALYKNAEDAKGAAGAADRP
jgi:hypothetical protein